MTTSAAPWLPMPGTRRTRRTAAVVACLVTLPALAACGGTAPVPVEPGEYADVRTDLAADVGLADASVWVGAEMVGVAAEQGEVNPVVSPLSLQFALAMLREGATGDALAQLDAVLGGGDVDAAVAALRERLDALEGPVAGIDRDDPPEQTLVHIADAVFVQEGFDPAPGFLERAVGRHGAEVAPADFAAGEAKQVLDEWVNRETGGLIAEVPKEPARDTLLTILDALVFAARWEATFDPSDTRPTPFTRSDGTTVTVPTMHQALEVPYATGDGWVAAEILYREGFAMRVVRHGGEPFDPAAWREVSTALGSAQPVRLTLAMPRWESTVTADLKEALIGLGADAIFASGDLDGIFDGAEVDAVSQTATITVAELGTVAAAVTQVDAVAGSAPVLPPLELRLDSPFEYQVYDASTGLVLFAGLVGDPSET